MARKQNKPSRYIRMVELEKEGPRAGTKRDISHLEVRIAVQESCFPHPEGTARQEIGSAKPAYCIQSPVLSTSESCCCGLLFQGSTPTGVVVGSGLTLSGIRLRPLCASKRPGRRPPGS